MAIDSHFFFFLCAPRWRDFFRIQPFRLFLFGQHLRYRISVAAATATAMATVMSGVSTGSLNTYWPFRINDVCALYDHYGVAANFRQFIKFKIRRRTAPRNTIWTAPNAVVHTWKMHSMLTDICLLCWKIISCQLLLAMLFFAHTQARKQWQWRDK